MLWRSTAVDVHSQQLIKQFHTVPTIKLIMKIDFPNDEDVYLYLDVNAGASPGIVRERGINDNNTAK